MSTQNNLTESEQLEAEQLLVGRGLTGVELMIDSDSLLQTAREWVEEYADCGIGADEFNALEDVTSRLNRGELVVKPITVEYYPGISVTFDSVENVSQLLL
ncbi:MAG: hypothetical protein ABL903_02020 [Methylococcales bacterium]